MAVVTTRFRWLSVRSSSQLHVHVSKLTAKTVQFRTIFLVDVMPHMLIVPDHVRLQISY
jgi:hypothetical protein